MFGHFGHALFYIVFLYRSACVFLCYVGPVVLPDRVEGLRVVESTPGGLRIIWRAVRGADGYRIYWRSSQGIPTYNPKTSAITFRI